MAGTVENELKEAEEDSDIDGDIIDDESEPSDVTLTLMQSAHKLYTIKQCHVILISL